MRQIMTDLTLVNGLCSSLGPAFMPGINKPTPLGALAQIQIHVLPKNERILVVRH